MMSGVTQLDGFVSKPIYPERKSAGHSETGRLNIELSRVIRLLEDPLSSSLKERHMFLLKKVLKMFQRGFLLKDLEDIFKIVNICAEKATDDSDYARVVCDLLHICGCPFLKEKTSDETRYATVVMDCLSQMGYLMRLPVPEIRHQICSSVMALYTCEKHKPGFDGACPTHANYRGLMVERSGLAETLVMSLPLMENQLSVKLRLLQTLQIMSQTSEVNCSFMLKAQAAHKICYHMSEHDPSGQVLFRSTEILWNLLENGSKMEVTAQLSNMDCIESLKQVFLHQLLNGFRYYDQQLRNDLLVITSLIADNPHAPFTDSGFVKHLTMLATFPELKSHNPLVRNLRLSFNHEDFEMKKLLLNVIVVLSKDLSALQLFKEGRVMLALMLLIKPRSRDVHRSRRSWNSSQQEELQLQALATLSTLAPLMLDEYVMCQANTCLLLLLDWCLQKDSFSGQGHGFHSTGGRGGKKAQMRYCIRVLRSIVCVGNELLVQDLCDQGAIGQLLGVLRWFLANRETEDDVSLEIQVDVQLILSVLCEGDLHRKELFGSDGVEILLEYLSMDVQLIFSGLGHNKLLLSTVDCVWSCVVGCFNTEDVFLERHGVHLLLHLLQANPRNMLGPLIGTLLELCENPQALPHVLSWIGENDATAPQLLLHIWREEEKLMGITQDQWRLITNVKHPVVSTSSRDFCSSVRNVSENLCANIYCLLCKLGFQQLSGLSTEDHITLSFISQYLDFKVAEVWAEILSELSDEGLTLISSDDEALKSIRQISENMSENVRSLQQSILERQHHADVQEERRMYAEISFTHKQRELAAEAWRNYVARTSNFNNLKEFKKLQEEQSSRGADVMSHVALMEP